MIDTLSEPGSWARAIRDGRIPAVEYATAPQRVEGLQGRGVDQLHNGSITQTADQNHV